MARVICDGRELPGAQVFIGCGPTMFPDPVAWVRELDFHNDFRRRTGRMLVDQQKWEKFLADHRCGTHEPLVFTIRKPGIGDIVLQVRATDFSPTGVLTIESFVLMPQGTR